MSMEQNKEHAFDAFCKRVVKNEAVNIQLEYSRQEQQEVVFSDLTPEERRQLQYIDTYAPERRVFRLFGMDMEISDGNLGRALDAVSKERRDIVLLAYLLGMTDVEIAKRLGLNRPRCNTAVQARWNNYGRSWRKTDMNTTNSKQQKLRTPRYKLLPYATIQAATQGDPDAIAAVLRHYEGYIAKLSTRRLFDEMGNVYLCVDETMRRRLEIKLIAGILTFKVA